MSWKNFCEWCYLYYLWIFFKFWYGGLRFINWIKWFEEVCLIWLELFFVFIGFNKWWCLWIVFSIVSFDIVVVGIIIIFCIFLLCVIDFLMKNLWLFWNVFDDFVICDKFGVVLIFVNLVKFCFIERILFFVFIVILYVDGLWFFYCWIFVVVLFFDVNFLVDYVCFCCYFFVCWMCW